MLAAHGILAAALIAVCAVAALSGLLAYFRGADPRAAVRQLLALAQTLLVAQVALGLLLVADDRRTGDDLHYVYGTLALAAVLAPWFYAPAEPRRRLAWFAVATLVAGALSVRAYMTA